MVDINKGMKMSSTKIQPCHLEGKLNEKISTNFKKKYTLFINNWLIDIPRVVWFYHQKKKSARDAH